MNFFVVFGVLACASLAKCQSADSEDLIGNNISDVFTVADRRPGIGSRNNVLILDGAMCCKVDVMTFD